MTTLAPDPATTDRREQVRAFMDAYVYPNEPALDREDDAAEELLRSLQAKVKEQGLWAPFIGPEAGGTGEGFMPYVFLNEIIGRSMWAPRIRRRAARAARCCAPSSMRAARWSIPRPCTAPRKTRSATD